VHKSSAVVAAERRIEKVYVEWVDSAEAREFLSAARVAFFDTVKGAKVRDAATKAALLKLEPLYRAEHPFILKSKEERQKLYLEWALARPDWGDLLHRELMRFRAYRDAESQASQDLLERFQNRPEVQPLIADLLAAEQEDREQSEATQDARDAERSAPADPALPPSLRAEKRAAKEARRRQLNQRRAEEAQARHEHRLNWLAQHARRSTA
jgi:hypothetical protein